MERFRVINTALNEYAINYFREIGNKIPNDYLEAELRRLHKSDEQNYLNNIKREYPTFFHVIDQTLFPFNAFEGIVRIIEDYRKPPKYVYDNGKIIDGYNGNVLQILDTKRVVDQNLNSLV